MFPRTGKPVGTLELNNPVIGKKYLDENGNPVDVNEKIKSIIVNPKYGDWFEIRHKDSGYQYICIYTVNRNPETGKIEDQWVWIGFINPEDYVQLYGLAPKYPNVLELEMVKDIWNAQIYASKFGFIFVEVPHEEFWPYFEYYLSIDEYREDVCLKEFFGE